MLKLLRKNYLCPIVLFLGTFFVYLHNLSASVYGGDVGDLVSAVGVMGVAHPPGYPLFTVLGILLNLLPISQTVAWKVGLISVFSSSLAVVILYLISLEFTKSKIISIISSLSLAFFYLFWLYAEVAEVFALNSLFILLLLFLALKYYRHQKFKYLYALSLVFGLSLTNNHVILLIVPSLFVLIISKGWKQFLNLKKLGICFLFFLLGLAPYIYVPIAAINQPAINWDNAVNLKNFIRLVTRADYGWAPKTSFLMGNLLAVKTYLLKIFIGLTPALVITSILGIIYLIQKKQFAFLLSLLSGFILFGPVFMMYFYISLTDTFSMELLERFYISSSIFIVILFSVGLSYLTKILTLFMKKVNIPKQRIAVYSLIVTLAFLSIPASLFAYNLNKTDLHNIWLGDTFGEDLINPLPKNSVVILAGDSDYFNAMYVKHIKKIRPDVDIINIGFFETDKILNNTKKKIKDIKKYPSDVSRVKILIELAKERPLFSEANISHTNKKYEAIKWEPYGLVYKFGESKTEEDFITEQGKVWRKIHIPSIGHSLNSGYHSLTLSHINSLYANSLARLGNYFVNKYSDYERGKNYFNIALNLDLNTLSAYKGLGYYYLNKKDCVNSEINFNKAFSLDPSNRNSYYLLYLNSLTCEKNNIKAKEISKKFKELFHTSIEDEIKKEIK